MKKLTRALRAYLQGIGRALLFALGLIAVALISILAVAFTAVCLPFMPWILDWAGPIDWVDPSDSFGNLDPVS